MDVLKSSLPPLTSSVARGGEEAFCDCSRVSFGFRFIFGTTEFLLCIVNLNHGGYIESCS